MSDWAQVRQHLALRYRLAYDEPDWCGLRWRLGDAEIDQRVERRAAFGATWVHVVTEVGPATLLAADAALMRNAVLPLGALAVERDRYLLRLPLELDGLTLERLDRWMQRAAAEAVRLRVDLVTARRSAPWAFAELME